MALHYKPWQGSGQDPGSWNSSTIILLLLQPRVFMRVRPSPTVRLFTGPTVCYLQDQDNGEASGREPAPGGSGLNKEATKLKDLSELFIYLKEKWPCHKTKHPFFHCLPLDQAGFFPWLLPINEHRHTAFPVSPSGDHKLCLIGSYKNHFHRKATWMHQKWGFLQCLSIIFSQVQFMYWWHRKEYKPLESITHLGLLRSAFIHSQKRKIKAVNTIFIQLCKMYTVFIFLHMAFHKTADFQGKRIKIIELVMTVFFFSELQNPLHSVGGQWQFYS